ncbi:MAG: type I-C CRISPR-associated protein Cas5 [Methanomicrobiales archaeon HGW-Methanomicrobiales-1]|nr:MAG: type I-C CRISPR-associated protein Cas5 [Methanomicrobiales archaeon HGW-Methanomicrobiales-1]
MDIGFGIKLKVWGDYACFTRPEMKVERVSYDVMTPSAARGILEAIYWKPAIVWEIDRIHVMKPVRFDNIRRNEVLGKIPMDSVKGAFQGREAVLFKDANDERVQRASLVLRDVCYYVEAHFNMTDKAGPEDSVEKHYNVALRRMRKGQCFHHPYFGCREFPVQFEFVDGEIPRSELDGKKDLGLMLWDIDFAHDMKAIFFRAEMNEGVIDVQKSLRSGVFS